MTPREVFPWEWEPGAEPDLRLVREKQRLLRKRIVSLTQIPMFSDYLDRVRIFDDCVQQLSDLESRYGTGSGVLDGFFRQFDGAAKKETPPPVLLVRTEVQAPLGFVPESSGNCCPECGTIMIFTEGCLLCQSCGYSKCG